LNWKQYLGVPNPTGDGRTLSPEAESLIYSLLCDEKHRLGSAPSLPEKPSGGASEIKKHPFFNSINFPQVEAHQMESLWRPPIQDPEDTTNFDFEIPCDPMPEEEISYDDDDNGNQFYGFTFRRFLTNGGPPPTFFQRENSSKSSSKSGKQTVDAVYV
jgi:hypothetical protein